jgi:hypothetical protein
MVNLPEAGFILRLNADPVLPCLAGQPSDPERIVYANRNRYAFSSMRHTRSGRVHLDHTPSSLGEPQRAVGMRGNCHLNRLAAVQHDEHGKFPKG